jgi:methyl-accepting chemotaxis protein
MLIAEANQNDEYLTVYFGLGDNTGVFSDNWPNRKETNTIADINTSVEDWSTLTDWKAPQRGWYKSAMANNKKVLITAPYQDALTAATVITVTKDMGKFGDLDAAVGLDVDIKTVVKAIDKVETFGGYSFIVDKEGHIVAHKDEKFNPKGDDYVSMADNEVYAKVFPPSENMYSITDYDGVKRYLFPCVTDSSGWILYAAIPHSAVSKTINPDITTLVTAALFLLMASVIVGMVIRRMVVTPLTQVVDAGTKIAYGDLDIALKADWNNELGQLVEQFGHIVETVKKQAQVLEAVSQRDFTVRIESRGPNDTMNIAIQSMIETINKVLRDIMGSATQVYSGSQQISGGAHALAPGSSMQTEAVQKLSASTTRIAAQTKANAEMAERAAKLADSIKGGAEKGRRQMIAMMTAVTEINQASKRIGDVIKVIDDIAFQTNLLALNAAVEAARAGQHGKGFAVVAEEVRNLASKSAEAARNTGELIVNSIKKAELGASIAQETAASFEEIVSGINDSSRIVADIAKSSEEQSLGIEEINRGIDHVAQIVEQNSTTAEQSATASKELTEQSDMLRALTSQFKLTRTT